MFLGPAPGHAGLHSEDLRWRAIFRYGGTVPTSTRWPMIFPPARFRSRRDGFAICGTASSKLLRSHRIEYVALAIVRLSSATLRRSI